MTVLHSSVVELQFQGQVAHHGFIVVEGDAGDDVHVVVVPAIVGDHHPRLVFDDVEELPDRVVGVADGVAASPGVKEKVRLVA